MLQVNNKTGEILIYDVIGQDWMGGGISAESVIEALDRLDGKRATVRINSPGGVADEGIAIYNALKRYEGGVDTVVDSLAASAASVIALAGENRVTAKGARWMIHRAMTVAMGNSTDIEKVVAQLRAYDASITEIYSQYMNKSAEEIGTLLEAETWYTSQESVDAGLSTAVEGETVGKPVAAAWFKNAPENLLDGKPKAFRPKPAMSYSDKFSCAR